MKKTGISAIAAIAGIASALAGDVAWTGTAGDGLWATSENWQGDGLPGNADTAVFDLGETATVDLGWANRSVSGLSLLSGSLCLTNGAISTSSSVSTTTVYVAGGAYLVSSNMFRSYSNNEHVLKLTGGGRIRIDGKIGRGVWNDGDASKPFKTVLVDGACPEFACDTFQNASVTAYGGSVLNILKGGWSYSATVDPLSINGATVRFFATETPGEMNWPSSASTANWTLKVGANGATVDGLFDETFADADYRQLNWYATSSTADGIAADGGIKFAYPGVTTIYKPQGVNGTVSVTDGRIVLASGAFSNADGNALGTGDFILDGAALWPAANLAAQNLNLASGEGAAMTYVRGASINIMRSSNCGQTVAIGPDDATATSLVRGGKGSVLAIMKSLPGGGSIDGESGKVVINGGVETYANGLVKIPVFGYYNKGTTSTAATSYLWEFLKYDADKGFVSAQDIYTTGIDGGADAIAGINVQTDSPTEYTVAQGETKSALALAIRNGRPNKMPLTISSGAKFTVGNGTDPACVILNNDAGYGIARIGGTGCLDFGTSEGVIAVRCPPTAAGGSSIAPVIAGSGGLTISGMSLDANAVPTLTLSGANTYSGGTWINSAQVRPADASAFGTGTVDVGSGMASGGQVRFGTAGLVFANDFVICGHGVKQQSDSSETDNGALWFVANTEISGDIAIDRYARITTRDAEEGARAVLSGVVSGGKLKVRNGAEGTSILLSNSNTYTGGTEIVSATLAVAKGDSLGAGAVHLDDGVLVFENDEDITFTNSVTGTGTIVLSGKGTVTFSGKEFDALPGKTFCKGTSFPFPNVSEGTFCKKSGLVLFIR